MHVNLSLHRRSSRVDDLASTISHRLSIESSSKSEKKNESPEHERVTIVPKRNVTANRFGVQLPRNGLECHLKRTELKGECCFSSKHIVVSLVNRLSKEHQILVAARANTHAQTFRLENSMQNCTQIQMAW